MAAPTYLLDTNICIYIRRERPPEVLKRFRALSPGSTAMSVVTYGELMFGAYKSPDPDRALQVLAELASLVPVLPMKAEVAEAYGRIRCDLVRRREILGNNDLWIAAHARSLDLTLVTKNIREFQRVKDLRLANWAGV